MSISLVVPTQGNPISLKRTIDSVEHIVDEIIVGSVCVFKEDEQLIESYSNEYNLKVLPLPFTYIYEHGFSHTLNLLASKAKNNVVLYLNVGEVFDSSYLSDPRSALIADYNCWYIDHATEKHRWWRCFDKREMRFDGLIHEECVGPHRPYHKPLFRFADTDKDQDPFKAKVYNDIKEILYWSLLIKIADNPELLGATSPGWLEHARKDYDDMKLRLSKKGRRPWAFEHQSINVYLHEIYESEEFAAERFETNSSIEFQTDKKFLL